MASSISELVSRAREVASKGVAASLGVAAFFAFFPWKVLNFLRTFFYRKSLNGKVALVTGASSGIGRALARELYVDHGCRVVLAARKEDELNNLKKELVQEAAALDKSPELPMVLPLDVTATPNDLAAKVNHMVSTMNGVDILVNCAGMSSRGSVVETSMETHRRVFDVDYFGMVNLTKCVLGHMISRGHGRIVQISSLQGLFAIPNRSAYGAAKHAMQAFSDSLRAEVSHKGIGVTVVSPGYVSTNLSRNALTGAGAAHGVMEKEIEQGYRPQDVARRVAQAIEMEEDEVVIAPPHFRLVPWLRKISPRLYFYIMSNRAMRAEAEAKKKIEEQKKAE